jgi:DNA-binding NarL/FixJ family response regulator
MHADESYVIRALAAGARAYLPKSATDEYLLPAVQAKEVATQLDVRLSTVETHRANLMQRLNLHSTAEIVLDAVRKGIIA